MTTVQPGQGRLEISERSRKTIFAAALSALVIPVPKPTAGAVSYRSLSEHWRAAEICRKQEAVSLAERDRGTAGRLATITAGAGGHTVLRRSYK
ncbi:MAG: hypothetical protein HY914_19475 [Desulfomonile tiedjei]|nr:hypothetical protein [Desulfomonile tiedjei]